MQQAEPVNGAFEAARFVAAAVQPPLPRLAIGKFVPTGIGLLKRWLQNIPLPGWRRQKSCSRARS
jgi:hypothetical protein